MEPMKVTDDKHINEMIIEKGLNAPRVMPEKITDVINDTQFHVFYGGKLTVCVLLLQNGFTVSGEAGCVSLKNYDKEVGEQTAYNNAVNKIWPLEGYALQDRLYSVQ